MERAHHAAAHAGGNTFVLGGARALQAIILHLRDRHAEAEAIVDESVRQCLQHHRGVLSTLLTYQAAGRLDAGRPVAREAAMTKLLASETAVKVTDEAARIFASYGLAMEYPVQRYFRDARFLLPGGGTSEILRVVIDRDLDWDRGQAFA